jgi:hypothetical protein
LLTSIFIAYIDTVETYNKTTEFEIVNLLELGNDSEPMQKPSLINYIYYSSNMFNNITGHNFAINVIPIIIAIVSYLQEGNEKYAHIYLTYLVYNILIPGLYLIYELCKTVSIDFIKWKISLSSK